MPGGEGRQGCLRARAWLTGGPGRAHLTHACLHAGTAAVGAWPPSPTSMAPAGDPGGSARAATRSAAWPLARTEPAPRRTHQAARRTPPPHTHIDGAHLASSTCQPRLFGRTTLPRWKLSPLRNCTSVPGATTALEAWREGLTTTLMRRPSAQRARGGGAQRCPGRAGHPCPARRPLAQDCRARLLLLKHQVTAPCSRSDRGSDRPAKPSKSRRRALAPRRTAMSSAGSARAHCGPRCSTSI